MKITSLIPASIACTLTCFANLEKTDIKPAFAYSLQDTEFALGAAWDFAYKTNYNDGMDNEFLIFSQGQALAFNEHLNTKGIEAGLNLRHEFNGEWLYDSIQYTYLKAYHESDQQFETRNIVSSLSHYIGQIEILPNQLELPAIRFGVEYVWGQEARDFAEESYWRYKVVAEHSLRFDKFDATQFLQRWRIKTRFDFTYTADRDVTIKRAGLEDAYSLSVALYYALSDSITKRNYIPWDIFFAYETGRQEPIFDNDDKFVIGVKYDLQ